MRKLGIWIRLLVVLAGVLYGQRELPREYVPAEELVSLNSDLEFSSALDILSEYAIRLSGKPLYDPTRQGGAIGVDITSLPWKKRCRPSSVVVDYGIRKKSILFRSPSRMKKYQTRKRNCRMK